MKKKSLYEGGSFYKYYKQVNPKRAFADYEYKLSKPKKALAVMRDFLKNSKKLKSMSYLDIGCGTGISCYFFADYFKECVGIDEDEASIEIAQKTHSKQNIKFIKDDAMNMPFKDNSFDVMTCCQVYEHVVDYQKLFDEIYRVLKPGGFCYLSAVNKYWLWEWHTDLPFTSFLPRKLANLYVRAFGKGNEFKEILLSYWKLKKELKNFKIVDYTAKIIKYPGEFEAKSLFRGAYFLLPKLPRFLLEQLVPFTQSFIFVLVKPERNETK